MPEPSDPKPYLPPYPGNKPLRLRADYQKGFLDD